MKVKNGEVRKMKAQKREIEYLKSRGRSAEFESEIIFKRKTLKNTEQKREMRPKFEFFYKLRKTTKCDE